MKILFGHPTGNPNSHHAALAHFEAGKLEAFCVPWMPSATMLALLASVPGLKASASRLAWRRFGPLARAPKIQGRLGEILRLIRRSCGSDVEGLSYEANDWLMRTMVRECRRKLVAAVHSYEDCSLWQFEEARRLGKACVYDMPIGYYQAWAQTQEDLARKYADWLPSGGLPSNQWVRPEQKRREMELADLVIAPSAFVRETILQFHPDKKIALAPYGVDSEFWQPAPHDRPKAPLRFVCAGQCSIRKGTPVLIEAWRKAGLKDATLTLVGSWQLAKNRQANLPEGIQYTGPVPREELREVLTKSDVFVSPTFFEGRTLAIGEALACGLSVITTPASGITDLVDATCGRIVTTGSEQELIEALRWFCENRHQLTTMKMAARAKAQSCTWSHYRQCVNQAVADFL